MPEKKEWWFMELIEEKLKTVTSYHGVIVKEVLRFIQV